MPILWLTWLRDPHFPLDAQQATYRAAAGPRMVAVLPDMGHSHQAGWKPPESYAFATAIVATGKPWAQAAVHDDDTRGSSSCVAARQECGAHPHHGLWLHRPAPLADLAREVRLPMVREFAFRQRSRAAPALLL